LGEANNNVHRKVVVGSKCTGKREGDVDDMVCTYVRVTSTRDDIVEDIKY
jgi:hypothetical protein